MITAFKIYENLKEQFNYYCFDWDDNLLFMSTPVYIDKLVSGEWTKTKVSTTKFAKIRRTIYDPDSEYQIRPDTYIEASDNGPRGKDAFLLDVVEAIKHDKFGPSWDAFIRCLVNANLFLIVTTRGHSPEVLKDGIRWIIFNYLSEEQRKEMIKNIKKFNVKFGVKQVNLIDDYLNNCEFMGVTSSYFKNKFGDVGSVGQRKLTAVKYFRNRIVEYMKKVNGIFSLGFSDDDIRFSSRIENFMRGEQSLYGDKYFVFDTSNPKKVKRVQI